MKPAVFVRASLPVFALLCFSFSSPAQPGSIDLSFDPGTGADTNVRRVIGQPDGKVLVAGYFTQFNGAPHGRMVRLNEDGTVDPGFDTGSGFDGPVSDMALQPDGKILVCGGFTSYNGTTLTGRIVRLEPDGSIDTGFSPPPFGLVSINAIALQPDGAILLAGNQGAGGAVVQFRLVRLIPTGAVDTTFSTTMTSFDQVLTDVEVLPDGRIAVLGLFNQYQGTGRSKVCILQSNGDLDPSFDPGTGPNAPPTQLAIAPDGKPYLVGGFTSFNGSAMNWAVRLNLDGSVDTSWNVGTGFTMGIPVCMLVRSDGDVMFGGTFTGFNGTAVSRLCRVNGDGSLDTAFDVGTGPDQLVSCIAQRPDGGYLIGGNFGFVAGTPRARVAALWNCTPVLWYTDQDGDGFGTGPSASACDQLPGRVANNLDCDDLDPLVLGPDTFHTDADGDGYGDPDAPVVDCVQPMGTVTNDLDCDDQDDMQYPDAEWYLDLDEDGYGDPTTLIIQCAMPGPGYIDGPGDCDDNDPDIWHNDPCDDNNPFTVNDRTNPLCVCEGDAVTLSIRVVLAGAYDAQTGLMRDDLRAGSLVPLVEPYTSLGFTGILGASMSIPSTVLEATGPNAVVDWVLVELRDPTDPSQIVLRRPCLVGRDGMLMELDGTPGIKIPGTTSWYHLAIRHRNHLAIMTMDPGIPVGSLLDLTDDAVPMHGTGARQEVAPGTMAMWSGNTTGDDRIRYTGTDNDRDPVLTTIGGVVPTNVVNTVYTRYDVNLDGAVKYTGVANDRDPILTTIGGTVPTAERLEQLP